MTSVEEALKRVLENQKDFGSEGVDLLQSVGRILAQEVFADRNFPPYDRVMMDGIAIDMATYQSGTRSFKIEKIQAAGQPQHRLEKLDSCIEVMTGAVLPENTNVVIPYEQCEIKDGSVTIYAAGLTKMQHVHLQGTDCKAGELLLKKYEKITPAMIGILASVGNSHVQVVRFPTITICSTGDELVDISEHPEAHQVRRSNVYTLAAALIKEGIHASIIHLPDDVKDMTAEITRLLKSSDVILFSGAVSKGKYDYLPMVLANLGMETIFHSVAQRPGKPFLFGKFLNQTLVFGFPGNPVSTFVCYHQFFRKWLYASFKLPNNKQFAALSSDICFKPPLACHLLVRVIRENGSVVATQVHGSTSGDLVTLTQVEALISLPAEREFFKEGEVFELHPVS